MFSCLKLFIPIQVLYAMRVNPEITLSILADCSDKLQAVTETDQLLATAIDYVHNTVRPIFASLILFDSQSFALKSIKTIGIDERDGRPPSIEMTENVAGAISRGGEVLAVVDEKTSAYLVIHDRGLPAPCELRLPFFPAAGCIGVLSLGKKESGTDYLVQEIDGLRLVMNLVSAKCAQLMMTESNAALPQPSLVLEPKIRIKSMEDESGLLGNCPAIHHIKEMIDRVAVEDVSVLITGESGTGKELIARAIHRKSKRASKPLVAMNCAALADNLVESELFGHEKGAFTGAISRKKGKFEFANDSTLFLDEIGDMSLQTQAKLLRVLQDGTFQRVGGNETLHSNARVLAATNKNLLEHFRTGTFREDLYYRINVVQIEMPPLRERGEDIVLLADHYFQYYNAYYRKNLSGYHREVYEWLLNYDFPGNIRELRNIIERAVIMERDEKIGLDSMPVKNGPVTAAVSQPAQTLSLEEIEKMHIRSVLDKVRNNKSAAARMLGIARKTLREKIQKYNIG